ncbi:MAG: hypothetical protein HUU08_05190 [Candidatus Brocadia sp.]|nr:hypothetical protein [Candidatus Brocadia sp.]
MTKLLAIVLGMLVGFYATVHGDTITLRNDGKDVDLKVTGVTGEYINAVILKKDIKSLNMQFLDTKNYPDVILLNVANVAVECKIKEISDDAIQVLIPTVMISSLKMTFQPGDKQVRTVSGDVENRPKTADVVVKEENTEQMDARATESKIREDVGGSGIADEIRTSPAEKEVKGIHYRLKTKKAKVGSAEVEDGLSNAETEDVPLDRNESVVNGKTHETDMEPSELKQGLVDESVDKGRVIEDEEDVKKEKPVAQDPNLGRVEGRILHGGKPLPECQVKLQMLEKSGLLTKGYRPVEGAMELEAVTGKDGLYRFMNVSPGQYKLYWKPSSETAWVRRFKMEPDVIVSSGKLTSPKEIETLKRTLN